MRVRCISLSSGEVFFVFFIFFLFYFFFLVLRSPSVYFSSLEFYLCALFFLSFTLLYSARLASLAPRFLISSNISLSVCRFFYPVCLPSPTQPPNPPQPSPTLSPPAFSHDLLDNPRGRYRSTSSKGDTNYERVTCRWRGAEAAAPAGGSPPQNA